MKKMELSNVQSGEGLVGRDLVNQIVGQAQALQASSDLLRTGAVSKHALVKENKLYQQLRGVVTPHGAELKGTWEEYCGLLGRSVDMVDRDITNLQEFGEEALEAMSRAGIGYRDLQQFRRLPVDEKTALIEAAKAGDKDTLLDLAETLIARQEKSLERAARDSEEKLKRIQKEVDSLRSASVAATSKIDAELQSHIITPDVPPQVSDNRQPFRFINYSAYPNFSNPTFWSNPTWPRLLSLSIRQ